MRPVLLLASRACESSWVPVGQTSQVRVHGMNGESVVMLLFDSEEEPLTIVEDGVYPLPSEAGAVKASLEVVVDSQISIDLE